MSGLGADSRTAKFDLTLSLQDTGQGLRGSLEYNTDLWDEQSMARMVGHFHNLVEAIVSDPDRRLWEMKMMGEAERRRLVVEWNQTGAQYSADKCVHELIERQAEQRAGQVAVSFQGRHLTYGQLNSRANQLAHYLREKGVGVEELVGVCVERGLEMVVAVVGVMKAGAAYVPMDPGYPEQRLKQMMGEGRVRVVVTQRSVEEKVSGDSQTVVRVDEDWEEISKQSEQNPVTAATSSNLAYVIYTSGSTGKPKGVEVGHASVVNLLESMMREPGMKSGEKLLAVTTISFDIAGLELYLPLVAGGEVEVASREEASDGRALSRRIAESGATVMQATPATWRMLMEAGWEGAEGMKVLCGGEAVTKEVGKGLLERVGEVWNVYGPTETTIWSGARRVERSEESGQIGGPIANTQMYIVGEEMEISGEGVAGELYIGGEGVGRGYRGNAEQTAERFVPDPYRGEAGVRMYRTGDKVRQVGRGRIEYLGRADEQVKVRGYRIEVGEIEEVMRSHRGVKESVVVVREDEGGDKWLVGYVVEDREKRTAEMLRSEEGPDTVGGMKRELEWEAEGVDPEQIWRMSGERGYTAGISRGEAEAAGSYEVVMRREKPGWWEVGKGLREGEQEDRRTRPEREANKRYANDPLQGIFRRKLVPELRAYLRERLPEYMVPDIFMMIDELPLTPNGKINRRALPSPSRTRGEIESGYIAPRNAVEEVVAGIWSGVLGIEMIGVYDNFFELGGHSLIATQVVSRVRERLGQELTLRSVFEQPTVAGMAEKIDRQRGKERLTEKVERVERKGRQELSYSQQRLWFIEQMEGSSSAYDMAVGVRIRGELKAEELERSLNEVVRRHEVLRTRFVEEEGLPVQEVMAELHLLLPVIDLSKVANEEREEAARRLANEEANRPFDLEQAPLLRALLLRLDEQDYVLVFTIHHIISDAWSMGILVRETALLYDAYSNGQPSPLAELPIQYADFAAWQRKWLSGEVLEEQLSYWKQLLKDAPAVLELPLDRPRPTTQTYRGAIETLVLPQELGEELKALSRSEGVTLFMTLMAAFQTLLHQYTQQDEILVGTNIANRNRAELEGLIGFFVNNLVFRADLSDCISFRDLLRQVREVALGAYAHQELPFERLVEELQPERSLSYNPIFQVMFALQNTPVETLTLPGLTLTPFDLSGDTSVFDLLLNMQDTEVGLVGTLQYNGDLFDSATIIQMLTHFQMILEAMIEDPDQELNSVSFMTEEERRIQIYAFNDD